MILNQTWGMERKSIWLAYKVTVFLRIIAKHLLQSGIWSTRKGGGIMNYPKIATTNSAKFLHKTSSRQVLRPGQIIQGEVVKIHPDQLAEIKLGEEHLIAKLEVGLVLGEKYYFQVTSNTKFPELRVIGEAKKDGYSNEMSDLLNTLGIKNNKHIRRLVQMFTNHSIPFYQKDLRVAAEIIKEEKDKQSTLKLLMKIVRKELPLTKSVFSSLKAVEDTTLTDQMRAVLQQLTLKSSDQLQSGQKQQLIAKLTQLSTKPRSINEKLINEIMSQIRRNDQTLLRVFQSIGLVSARIDFPTWAKNWQRFMQSTTPNERSPVYFPYQLDVKEFLHTMQKIITDEVTWDEKIQQLQAKWNTKVTLLETSSRLLLQEEATILRADIQKVIFPYVGEKQKALLNETFDANQLISLYSGLKSMSGRQLNDQLKVFVEQAKSDERILKSPPQQQFMEHFRQSLSTLGFDYENRLWTERDSGDLAHSIKGLLLQLITDPETVESKQMTRLLQIIQGLQLQSVAETATMVHASIQIPAERLGLVKDLQIEFEGGKQKDGKLDPDFCRIFFYLHLEQIKETIIDVNIQKRAVTLTVFNHSDGLQEIAGIYKDELKQKLQALNYKLTSLSFKKIEEREKPSTNNSDASFKYSAGVDYRV